VQSQIVDRKLFHRRHAACHHECLRTSERSHRMASFKENRTTKHTNDTKKEGKWLE
jgi:hypothetical protein